MDEFPNIIQGEEEEIHDQFIHFDTTKKCEEFITQFGISYVTHICCRGKGFGYMNTIVNRTRIQLITRRQNRRQEPSIQEIPIPEISLNRDISTELDCTVCLEPNRRFTPCMHNLCIKCEVQLSNKICPICRVSLTT
jgi:hypothetical protein